MMTETTGADATGFSQRPGAVLGERYTLSAPIALGSASEVWRARDERLGRDVAVKLLPGSVVRDPRQRSKLEREAKALAAVSHRHLVGVFDYGEQPASTGPPMPYLVLELVEGPHLARHIERSGSLDVEETGSILRAILAGLARVHAIGVVHGDLKPGNVLLSADGPKVGDFGVARVLGQETQMTARALNPAYAAPETVRGEPPSAASDVWSAGCIAFEMVTGQRPFTQAAIFGRVAAEQAGASRVRELRPDVPDWLAAAISRSLAFDPADRYQDAQAFLTDIDSQVSGGGRSAPPEPAGSAGPTIAMQRPETEVLGPPPLKGRRRAAAAVAPVMAAVGSVARDVATSVHRAGSQRGISVAVQRLRAVPPGIAIAVVAVLLLAAMRMQAGALVAVPEVIGLPADAAADLMSSVGLGVQIEQVEAGGVAGMVVEQQPRPGSHVAAETTVLLRATTGAPQVIVPATEGMSVEEAIGALAAHRLAAGSDVVYERGSGQPPGRVIRTEPPAGATVDQGSNVQIFAEIVPAQPASERSAPARTQTGGGGGRTVQARAQGRGAR